MNVDQTTETPQRHYSYSNGKVSSFGEALAKRLAPFLHPIENPGPYVTAKPSREDIIICSRISHHAPAYKRLQEEACNGVPDHRQKRHNEKESQIEANVTRHVRVLDDRINVIFTDDPRGATIKLTLPEPFKYLYDDFGHEGVCVPNS